MVHLIYKLSKSFILPVVCIFIEIIVWKKRRAKVTLKDICLKWFLVWGIGFSAISVGFMQAFNPDYTANLLQLTMNDYIIIKELGYAQIGIGIVALLSYKKLEFRKPAAIAYGIFIACCTVNHMMRMNDIGLGEIVSMIDNVWVALIAVWTICHKPEHEKRMSEI